MITIRYPVLLMFILSLIGAGYIGFASISLSHDKLIHFSTFFILTTEFYFIARTRSLKLLGILTFIVCTLCGGIGSEFVQHIVNNKRVFDPMDIFCNVLGSALGLGLSVVYQTYNGRAKTQPIDIELSSSL